MVGEHRRTRDALRSVLWALMFACLVVVELRFERLEEYPVVSRDIIINAFSFQTVSFPVIDTNKDTRASTVQTRATDYSGPTYLRLLPLADAVKQTHIIQRALLFLVCMFNPSIVFRFDTSLTTSEISTLVPFRPHLLHERHTLTLLAYALDITITNATYGY